jgi:hypothetical protein
MFFDHTRQRLQVFDLEGLIDLAKKSMTDIKHVSECSVVPASMKLDQTFQKGMLLTGARRHVPCACSNNSSNETVPGWEPIVIEMPSPRNKTRSQVDQACRAL